MAGKGSRARPKSVSSEKFAANWDAIFSKKKEETDQQETVDDISIMDTDMENKNYDGLVREYMAMFVDKHDANKRIYGYYSDCTADEALDQAKNQYPDLELMAISPGPSIDVRREQIEKYGRWFFNAAEEEEFLNTQSITTTDEIGE